MLSLSRFKDSFGLPNGEFSKSLKNGRYAEDPTHSDKYDRMKDPLDFLEKAPDTGKPKSPQGQNGTVTGSARVVIDVNGKETPAPYHCAEAGALDVPFPPVPVPAAAGSHLPWATDAATLRASCSKDLHCFQEFVKTNTEHLPLRHAFMMAYRPSIPFLSPMTVVG